MAFLEMKNVTKNFGVVPVLRGLNLNVNEHQVVCLIGPSGCGKSTLLRCINGLEPIQQGEIRLAGDRVSGPGVDLNKESIDYLTALGPLPDDGNPTTARLPAGTQWYRTNPDGTVNDYIHLAPYGANQYAILVSKLVLKNPDLKNLAAHVLAPSLPQPGLSVRSNY